MNDKIAHLLKRSAGPLGDPVTTADALAVLGRSGPCGIELADVLSNKNGFHLLESALLFRPIQDAPPILGLESWNSAEGWKAIDPELTSAFFFAENILGEPFAIHRDRIVRLDPETAEWDDEWPTLESWLGAVVDDPNYLTGWSLAHEWQESFGPIPLGKRLLPRQPFVLGGTYDISNLVLAGDADGMSARLKLSKQIRDNPDGSHVTYELRI